MAMKDQAVITPAVGFIFTAPVGTSAPSPEVIDTFTPATELGDWHNIGHTARDELPTFGYEGGETENRGTWQNATFHEVVTEVASDYVTFNAHQFDNTTLGLYYGTETGGDTEGVFAVASAPTSTVGRALLIIIMDGDVNIGFHAASTSIRREESMELATDAFAYMPLRATFRKQTGTGAPLFSWISLAAGINMGS